MKCLVAILSLGALALAGSCSPTPPGKLEARELAQRLGCFACHAPKAKGGVAAPLDGIDARLSPQDLHLVLTYPRRLHPGAKMPSYAYLPREEREALVDFLVQWR